MLRRNGTGPAGRGNNNSAGNGMMDGRRGGTGCGRGFGRNRGQNRNQFQSSSQDEDNVQVQDSDMTKGTTAGVCTGDRQRQRLRDKSCVSKN